MMRQLTRRLRQLMKESEQALAEAVHGPSALRSRIAQYVLGDAKTRRLWESRHSGLLSPVAEINKPQMQVIALRQIDVKLVHRRAFFDYLRSNGISGKTRERLFSVFYGTWETDNAVLAEHRQYQLAVSSRVSVDHLIDVMHDSPGGGLLGLYESAYSKYFELYCQIATCDDKDVAAALKPSMLGARADAVRLRQRLAEVQPTRSAADLQRCVELARSGRYPVLNYMVG